MQIASALSDHKTRSENQPFLKQDLEPGNKISSNRGVELRSWQPFDYYLWAAFVFSLGAMALVLNLLAKTTEKTVGNEDCYRIDSVRP